jgi:hypothetical protein
MPDRPALEQPFVVQVMVRDDQQHKPISGARVGIIGRMDHPGMAPVVVNASESEPGVYRGSVTLGMAGAWVLQTTATLPDGRRAQQSIGLDMKP